MFKDYDKYLSASLKVYLFVLVVIFIMKIVGLDYFGLSLDNPIMVKISDFLLNNRIIRNTIYFIPMFLNEFVIVTISCNDNSKRMKLFLLLIAPIFYIFEANNIKIFGNLSMLTELIYLILIVCIYKRKMSLKLIKKTTIVTILAILIQLISTVTRYRYSIEYVNNIIANLLLNLDYIIILIIIYKLYFTKGDKNLWTYLVDQCLSLLKKMSLKNLLTKLQKNLLNFKKKSKEEKLTIIIYLLLSLIWNVFTVFVVLFIAKLNHTLIECIFILTSFWLSKRIFGKAFHLSSMIHCFIVSNLTYYVLNRITTPLGISIFVPILLGVGLSYFTSKLVKKTYKPLYKGMPESVFEETILKVIEKDSMKYKICYDFYIEGKSDLSLTFKYNYSLAGIRKIRMRVNDKIRELN